MFTRLSPGFLVSQIVECMNFIMVIQYKIQGDMLLIYVLAIIKFWSCIGLYKPINSLILCLC